MSNDKLSLEIGAKVLDRDNQLTGTVVDIAYKSKDASDVLYEKMYLIRVDKFRLFKPSTYWTNEYYLYILDKPKE